MALENNSKVIKQIEQENLKLKKEDLKRKTFRGGSFELTVHQTKQYEQ